MKKLVMLFALALVVAFATGSYAEVQNVKVGGDIRIRGYYDDADDLWASGHSFGYIQQRTRAIVEADLTDNVAVNATVEADGLWGTDGLADKIVDLDVRSEWDVGMSEAWVQLSELYYTPLTVKIGRQYLNYGTGFIVSSAEYENNFDAVKAVLNFEPWTLDLVYGKLNETGPMDDDKDLAGANLRYSADTWNVEGYFWAQIVGGDDIYIPGIRGDITPVENLDLWGELAYAFDGDLGAFGIDLGGTYKFADIAWKPTVGLAYSYGQGDKDGNFPDTWEYDYYGYLYSPKLSNIHIINANLKVEPIEKLALILDYYHYIQDEKQEMSMADFQDNLGFAAVTNGADTTLGNEVDLIAEYDYTEDVSTQLYLAWFWPGDAYDGTAGEDDAYEVRGEIIVSF